MATAKKIDIKDEIKDVTDPQIAKIIQKIIDDKFQELQSENENLKKEITTFKTKKSTYKFVPNNTKVKIKSNIDGKFIFMDKKGKINVYVTLRGYGDVADLDYDEVRVLNTDRGDYFKRGILSVEEVMSEDENITSEDIYRDLRIDKLYKNKFNPTNFEDLFKDDVTYKVFEKYLLDNKEVAETILIISSILYKQGRFNDNAKMSFFKRNFRNQNLYS
jgi:hypothetical protein